MGCHRYTVLVPQSWTSDRPDEPMYREVDFMFDGEEDCLCTFPHNRREDPCAVPTRQLALLGAATVLARQSLLDPDRTNSIPGSLPSWIVQGIDQSLPKNVEALGFVAGAAVGLLSSLGHDLMSQSHLDSCKNEKCHALAKLITELYRVSAQTPIG